MRLGAARRVRESIVVLAGVFCGAIGASLCGRVKSPVMLFKLEMRQAACDARTSSAVCKARSNGCRDFTHHLIDTLINDIYSMLEQFPTVIWVALI